MPTFGITTADEEAEFPTENDHYFRKFIYSSMQFLRGKKFSKAHADAVKVVNEEASRSANTRKEAIRKFEEKRRLHAEAFNSSTIAKSSQSNAQLIPKDTDFLSVSQSWLEEYDHPSSTAAIQVHESLTEHQPKPALQSNQPVVVVQRKPLNAINEESILSNSIPSHLYDESLHQDSFNFSSTSVFGDAERKHSTPAHPSGLMTPESKQGMKSMAKLNFNLDLYDGTRPSFGGSLFTSTPLMKAPPTFEKGMASSPQCVNDFSARHANNVHVVTPSQTTSLAARSSPHKLLQRTDSVSKPKVDSQVSPLPAVIAKSDIAVEEPTRCAPAISAEPSDSMAKYYATMVDEKEDNELGKHRFEKGQYQQLRSLLKRTIIDKISLCAKKLASKEHIAMVSSFLAKLIRGVHVQGFNDMALQIADKDAVCYAVDLIASHCLGIAERDPVVVPSIVSLLSELSAVSKPFETHLVGKLLSSSNLLSLDMSQCELFVDNLMTQSNDIRAFEINKEKTLMRVFFSLHVNEHSGRSLLFNLASVWRYLAFALNTQHRIFGTVIVLNVILTECAHLLAKFYPKQWPKLVRLTRTTLLPNLEKSLLSSEKRKSAGEAVHISVLENTLESL